MTAETPRSLRDHLDALDKAAHAQASAAADMVSFKKTQAQAWAAEIYDPLVALIQDVLEVPSARSVEYHVSGERASRRRGQSHVADPYGIGTHITDVAFGLRISSTYGGVWPALVWHCGWDTPSKDETPMPALGSVWFNKQGIVVAGPCDSPMTKPPIFYYCSVDCPPGRMPRSSPVGLGRGYFGPIHVNDLHPDHLFHVCEKALEKPTIVSASVARIIRGEEPQTEY